MSCSIRITAIPAPRSAAAAAPMPAYRQTSGLRRARRAQALGVEWQALAQFRRAACLHARAHQQVHPGSRRNRRKRAGFRRWRGRSAIALRERSVRAPRRPCRSPIKTLSSTGIGRKQLACLIRAGNAEPRDAIRRHVCQLRSRAERCRVRPIEAADQVRARWSCPLHSGR